MEKSMKKKMTAIAMYELLPAFIVAMLCLVTVSLATGEPSKEIQEEFEEVGAGK